MSRPFRYTFILGLVAVSTCLAAFGGWRFARASAPVAGPIVLVSIDALRADHLPAYGYTSGQTPALDSLVADGVIFERAYSHVPETLPSHVTLLSGRLPFETGVRDGVGATVPASERLLARMLSDRGFETGGVVSSFLLRAETGLGLSEIEPEYRYVGLAALAVAVLGTLGPTGVTSVSGVPTPAVSGAKLAKLKNGAYEAIPLPLSVVFGPNVSDPAALPP